MQHELHSALYTKAVFTAVMQSWGLTDSPPGGSFGEGHSHPACRRGETVALFGLPGNLQLVSDCVLACQSKQICRTFRDGSKEANKNSRNVSNLAGS